MELDECLLKAIHVTKPIDYEDKLIELSNTIQNLQSLVDALSFSHLPAIQSKEYGHKASIGLSHREHKGIMQKVSDLAITSQIEEAESQEEQFSTPARTAKKKTFMHYDLDSKQETYKELFRECNHTKPVILIIDYAKNIKNVS